MKKIISILFIILGSTAFAKPDSELLKTVFEKEPKCGTFVRYDDANLYLGFGYYKRGVEEPRFPIPARMRVVPLNGQEAFDLTTDDGALDIVVEQNRAFVLTYSSIEEWDLASREKVTSYAPYAITRTLRYKEHAQAMARYQDKLIVAHGRLGVSIFSLDKKRVTNQFRLVKWQSPRESMATGVTVQGKYAYVVMDNFTVLNPPALPPFRGIIVIDMESETVVSELEGMDPGVTSVASDENVLIASFGGIPLWKYSLTGLKGKTAPAALLRIWRFPLKGHPTGAAAMDEKYYYTCFLKAPEKRGDNGGWYKKIPVVLDRRVLMLD